MYIENTIHHHLPPFIFFMQPNCEARQNAFGHVNVAALCTNGATPGRNDPSTWPLASHVLLLLLLSCHNHSRAVTTLLGIVVTLSIFVCRTPCRTTHHNHTAT